MRHARLTAPESLRRAAASFNKAPEPTTTIRPFSMILAGFKVPSFRRVVVAHL
jgi:hypothetical protein